MAASEVVLPVPRAAHEDHQAALVHGDVAQDGRQSQFGEVGDGGADGAQHAADLALLHEGIDAEAADAAGEMAKLHSLVASNSAACLSFMMARASSAVCCGVSTWLDWGVMRPSTLMAGGKPAVMNRSDPFFCTIRRKRSYMKRRAWSRSMACSGG